MDITRASLRNPAAVAVIVAMVAVFGLIALRDLPLQLFPDIDRPQMSIVTNWRAAAPTEIESEILEPQEEVLQGLPGLEEMDGNANQGASWVNLTFAIGTDMSATMVDVLGRLNRLPPLPADANPPVVQLNGQDANTSLSWFFVQLLPGTQGKIEDYRRFIEATVKPRLESVPGVAAVEVNGGAPEELSIDLDLRKAADLGVSIPQVAALAGRANDVSGGFVDVGRRQYTLRFAGRYRPEDLAGLVLAWRDGETSLLASSLTRAVLFSAMTTAVAFGSLFFSSHPGTSSMGELLALSLCAVLAQDGVPATAGGVREGYRGPFEFAPGGTFRVAVPRRTRVQQQAMRVPRTQVCS